MLSLLLTLLNSSARLCSRLFFKQKYTIEQTMITWAMRPIVKPTAPLRPRPPVLSFEIGFRFCEFGGTVGVTVIVLTWPVTVSREITGVGVQVEDADSDVEDCVVSGAAVVSGVPDADCE
jgi:hypothetical protein